MADYEGGRVLLQVVPVFRNIQRLIGAEAKKWGADAGKDYQQGFDGAVGKSNATPGPTKAQAAKQGNDAGGAFADTFRRRVEAAAKSLPPVMIGAVATEAEQKLRDLRLDMERLSRQNIGVDLSTTEAMVELEALDERLKDLARRSPEPKVRIDAQAARAQIVAVRAQLTELDNLDVDAEIRVTADEAATRKQGDAAGGAFADAFRRRVESAARSLPPTELRADASDADREIRDIRLELEELGTKTVGVDIDPAAALAQIERINRRLTELGTESADVQVRADTLAAMAQLTLVSRMVDALDGQEANVRVDANTDFAEANLNSFTGRLILLGTAGASLAPAIVPAAGAAAVALAGIGAGALAGLGGIGALIIGLRGVGDAVKALGEQQKNAGADAQAAAEKQAAAARSLESAQRQLENAERGLANARANAADQAEQSARRIADAQEAVAEAMADAGEAAEDAARRVADAERDLADAITEAAEAAERANERIADAQTALSRAMRDSAEASEDMARRVESAQEAIADATEDASRDIERALGRQDDAEQSLARSQRDTRDAQDDLTQARVDAAEALEDLELATRAASLAEEDAAIALARAQGRYAEEQDAALQGAEARRLNLNVEQAEWSLNNALDRLDQIMASDKPDPIEVNIATAGIEEAQAYLAKVEADRAKYQREAQLDLADAELGVRQAQLRVDEAAERNKDIIEQANDARAKGVDGAEAVVDAERRVQDARQAEIEAAERLAEAERAVTDARLEGAERISDAQERYTDALRDQERQQRDAAEREIELQENLADAIEARADSEVDSNRRIADAQIAVTDALREQQRQQVDSAERIEDAQQRVTDAIRAQETQQRQSAMSIAGAVASVEGAQAAVAAAVAASAVEMSTSAQKAQEALDALGPAGQRFAQFIFGLRGEWDKFKAAVEESVLPGVQRGIENMLPLIPTLTTLMTSLGGAVGTLFEEMGASLAGADWAPFFEYLNDTGADTLLTIGRAFGDIALTIANLMVAFAPLTDLFIGGFGEMAASMAEWSRGLGENEGFQGFLQYLKESLPQVGEFLRALGGAFTNIIVSMAPFGPLILGAITGVLDFIAALDPAVLSGIVLGILGVVGGVNLFRKALDFGKFIKANPFVAIAAGIIFLVMQFINAYQTSETFRDKVDKVLKVVGDTATWLWEKAIKPAFDAIGALVMWVWDNVIKPLLPKIGEAFTTAGDVATWLWEKAIKPAFDAIGGLVKWIWDNVVSPLLPKIGTAFETAGNVATWLWEKAIKPAFDAIGGLVKWVWDNVVSPLLPKIGEAFTAVGNVATWLWEKAIKPAWDAISGAIAWAWNEVISPTLAVIGEAIGGLGGIFDSAVKGIKVIWDTVKDIAKAPIRFVIETVLNDGLIQAFNWIADKLPGIDKIDRIKLPQGFATGGIYPGYTPGRDVGFIGVSGGEAIMRPEWTKAIGSAKVHEMNAIARTQGVQGVQRYLGGFAGGGIPRDLRGAWGAPWDAITGAVSSGAGWVADKVGNIAGAAKNFVIGNLKKAAEAMLNPIINGMDDIPGFLGDVSQGLVRKLAGGLFDFAGANDGDEGAAGEIGNRPIAGGGQFTALINHIRGALSGKIPYVVTSTYRPGGTSYHGKRKAADFSSAGHGNRGYRDPNLRAIFEAFLPIGGNLAELILAGAPFNIKNGKQVPGYSWGQPGGKGNHWNHVHAALFDQGGRLPTGLTMVQNATGSPELVLNGQQESAIEAVLKGRLVPMGAEAGGGVEFPDPDLWARQAARTFSRALVHESRAI